MAAVFPVLNGMNKLSGYIVAKKGCGKNSQLSAVTILNWSFSMQL
jgi:hypothetical protein